MDSSTANDANIPVEDSYSCTNFTVAKFCHTWMITNFSLCELQQGKYLGSVNFPFRVRQEHDTNEWYMRVYPKGYNEKTKEYLMFGVWPIEYRKHKVKCTMGTVNAKGARLTLPRLTSSNTFGITLEDEFVALVKQNDLLNKTSGMMQGDNLVLFCEMQVVKESSKTLQNLNVTKYTEPQGRLLANIGQLYDTKKFSDVTITVGETKFEAHKNILAAQSAKLSAMLEHDTEETNKKKKIQYCIDMTGIDDKVVKKMLHFLYTGTVNNINENTVGLLVAAKEYELQELKIMCEKALCVSLTVENAADTLILANHHRADQLKSRAISFICSHAEDVAITTGFHAMITAQPSLLIEVFCRLAQQKNCHSHYASETDASASTSNASASNTR